MHSKFIHMKLQYSTICWVHHKTFSYKPPLPPNFSIIQEKIFTSLDGVLLGSTDHTLQHWPYEFIKKGTPFFFGEYGGYATTTIWTWGSSLGEEYINQLANSGW